MGFSLQLPQWRRALLAQEPACASSIEERMRLAIEERMRLAIEERMRLAIEERMRLAIELARRNVEEGTGGPFGALLWPGVRRLACGARKEDVESLDFDEGPKPPGWPEVLHRRSSAGPMLPLTGRRPRRSRATGPS